MQKKIGVLIQKYQEELKVLERQGYDECYDCCDYTSVGTSKSYIRSILKDLKNIKP